MGLKIINLVDREVEKIGDRCFRVFFNAVIDKWILMNPGTAVMHQMVEYIGEIHPSLFNSYLKNPAHCLIV